MQRDSTYADGLNYVPFLSQQDATPSSSRTSCSLSSGSLRRRSNMRMRRAHVIAANALYCDGNYEGDVSMFGRRSHLATQASGSPLIDSDSDAEGDRYLRKVLAGSRSKEIPSLLLSSGLSSVPEETEFRRFCKHYINMWMRPEHVAKVSAFVQRVQQNRFCCQVFKALQVLICLVFWLLHLVLMQVLRLQKWTQCLWRANIFMRNMTRRLLWWLTLSKHHDIFYFGLNIAVTPLLFVISLIALIVSVYCFIRDCVVGVCNFVRYRVY